MSSWGPLLLLSWHPIFKSSHCYSFEDRAPVAETWQHDRVPGWRSWQCLTCPTEDWRFFLLLFVFFVCFFKYSRHDSCRWTEHGFWNFPKTVPIPNRNRNLSVWRRCPASYRLWQFVSALYDKNWVMTILQNIVCVAPHFIHTWHRYQRYVHYQKYQVSIKCCPESVHKGIYLTLLMSRLGTEGRHRCCSIMAVYVYVYVSL